MDQYNRYIKPIHKLQPNYYSEVAFINATPAIFKILN